jgi:outer membrane protein OmpA-like peptidoglycan-associated protein
MIGISVLIHDLSMQRTRVLYILFSLAHTLNAQQHVAHNLLLNPGFEEHLTTPEDWFYSGSDFSRVMRYWDSATGASPDAYGPDIYVPKHWRDKGFGEATAHSGACMVGITVYGCNGGKPHCREYIQTQLTEPLVPGQRYQVAFWTKHLPASLQVDNLSAAFSDSRISLQSDDLIGLNPIAGSGRILKSYGGRWLYYQSEFLAETEAGYLLIGNFKDDAHTRVGRQCDGDCLPFAYYYIDDVTLKKLPPILPIPVAQDALARETMEAGKTIRLNYILFDSGKAEFQPRSFAELKTLLAILDQHPGMSIEVYGHTDNLGSEEYNLELSLKRAVNVVTYLVEYGIASDRLSYKGFGHSSPIADNNTEKGRNKNRRVEFYIVKM